MKTYGVVFGGGGAKGGYEIGVWKALRELEVPVAMVAGTSVGALNGAIMVQGDYDAAEKLWTSMSIDSVIKVEKELAAVEEDKSRAALIINTIKTAIKFRGLDVTPLKELLQQVIDEKRVRESDMELGIVTFSLTDFKPLSLYKNDIPEGKLVDYLLASACFPGFKSQKIDNKRYIDGGVYDNMPVSMVIEKGIKDIIVVDISGIGIVRKVDTRGLNIINIKNSQNLGGTLNFDGERSRANIEMGYLDTLKAFGKYKGVKYYLEPLDDYHSFSRDYFRNLNMDDLKKMYSFLGLDWGVKANSRDKLIIYKIMKTIKQYADGKLSGDTIVPAMAEITAEQIGIDRSRTYNINELIEKILEQYNNVKSDRDFNEYIKYLGKLLLSRSQREFDMEVKKILIEGKFLIYYNPDISEKDEKIKRFRKFVAMAFPKISIANMFVSLILSKKLNDGTLPPGSIKASN